MDIINVGPLARLSVEKFVLSVGARTSAPGGGSVAALLAGLVCFNCLLLSLFFKNKKLLL
jgi:formiminotetrahydrofolate cyclodeaminase